MSDSEDAVPRRAAVHQDGRPAGELGELGDDRWAFTYGDRIEALFARVGADPGAAEEIAPGVTRAELEYSVEAEDAMTAEDFLLRRTKLQLLLDEAGREAVRRWFATATAG